MWWRLSHADFERRKGATNRRALKRIVSSGVVPGLLAYSGGEPVGWCAVQPREAFPRLERSRILKPVDDQPVWSVTCLYIKRGHRGKGLSRQLLEAAVKHARSQGARIVEGYPVEPKSGKTADVFVFTGVASAYRKAGFKEVARRSNTRPIMRRHLRRTPSRSRNARTRR
jgi:GNAT superfamily N-acetyltransferase